MISRRSIKIASLITLALLLSALAAFGPAAPLVANTEEAEAPMRNAITEALSDANLPEAFWGIAVRNLRTGQMVYSLNADKNLVPASNLKLFTTAVALDALGGDYRYNTTLYFRGQTVGDTLLRGDLILRGSGDPTFGSALSGNDPLRTWSEQLAAMGVRRIEGRIIGDDDVMDDEPFAEGWDVAHIATERWAQSVGGLSYSDNLVNVRIEGTSAGRPARVTTSPEGYSVIRGTVTTGRGQGYNPIRLQRTIGTNNIVVTGSVSSGYRGTVQIPIEDPTAFTLHSFRTRLAQAGIAVSASLIDSDDLPQQLSYDNAQPLFTHVSPPLVDILSTINEKSNNFYAEQVFRTFAPGGFPRGGQRQVISFLNGAGVRTEGLSIRDGSGLSRKNLVTPESFVGLLAHMHRHEERQAFTATLARGGGSGTTLRYRLGGVPVRAKTGSLEYVRGLTGYVDGPDGTPYAFCILANNYTTRSSNISAAQDRIVQAIARGGRP
jgi:serine-type D-Ala-D-Ala carboxypeptidase/endopeptidase (penicillin-binding protein 4)